ncbi:MAG TPA: hypothetical protein VIE89_01045 [Candidatus Binatia bacterium]|jgi:hypothetical protein
MNQTANREVANRFKGLEIDACPFANLQEKKQTQWALAKEEMKNCVWLKPELMRVSKIVQVGSGSRTLMGVPPSADGIEIRFDELGLLCREPFEV